MNMKIIVFDHGLSPLPDFLLGFEDVFAEIAFLLLAIKSLLKTSAILIKKSVPSNNKNL